MGRMLRITLPEGEVQGIDLGVTQPGKIWLYNTGTEDIRIGYDPFDVGTTGVSYFTLLGGSQYLLDVGPGIGFVAQNQTMYFVSPSGSNTLEVWVADGS